MPLPRPLRSVGFRYALLHTLVFVALVSAIGATAEFAVTTSLQSQARQRVETEADALAAEFVRAGAPGLKASIEARLSTSGRRLRYALSGGGEVLMGDAAILRQAGEVLPDTTVLRATPDNPDDLILITTRMLPNGRLLHVADDLDTVEDVEHVLTKAFVIALSLAIILGLGAGWALSRVILGRVESVAETTRAISAGDLSRRIVLDGSGHEFELLARVLNGMLDRIAGLVEGIRQITSDVAHDLRTPLSRLRQTLEVARIRAKDARDYERAIEQAIGEADAILETFSALLRIAQIEAGAQRSAFRSVDLGEVVRTVVEAYEPAVADAGRVIEAETASDAWIDGDRELLLQLFVNLIENALAHTPVGTRITVRVAHEADLIRASVADDGPGIPADELSNVLRRFYRLQRSRTTPGSGLGLSLVAAIAELHGAALHLEDAKPGLCVVTRWPARPPPRVRHEDMAARA